MFDDKQKIMERVQSLPKGTPSPSGRYWCVTCKINESAALSSPRVADAMRKANAAYLVGDWTRRDDAITRELQAHGRSGVPLYLLYRPGRAEPEILPQLLTEGVVVDALKD